MKKIFLLTFIFLNLLFISGCDTRPSDDIPRYYRPIVLDEDSLELTDFLEIEPIALGSITNPKLQAKYPDDKFPKLGSIDKIDIARLRSFNSDIIYISDNTFQKYKNQINIIKTNKFKIDILDLRNHKFLTNTLQHLANNHQKGEKHQKYVKENLSEYKKLVDDYKEKVTYKQIFLVFHVDANKKVRVATKYSYLGVLLDKLDCIDQSTALKAKQEEDIPYISDDYEKELESINFHEPEHILILNDNKANPEETVNFIEELFATEKYQKVKVIKAKKYRFLNSEYRYGYAQVNYMDFFKEITKYLIDLTK